MKNPIEAIKSDLAQYQSVPFWSWNDRLEPEVLKQQIRWMKSQGIGGFFMHARGGLRTEYLSEDWMQCVDACIETAEEQGMQAWIYDENGWPSGFAGGKLLEKEENRDAHITYAIGSYDDKAWLTYSLAGEALKRITEPTQEQCLNLYLHISPSTADILNGEVVDQFLAETHEKYARRYGAQLPQKLAGIFTDEPQYYRWGVAYTRVMPAEYRKRYGEELFDSLGLLIVEKDGYRTFRYRYWLTMHQLMLENFGKKIYNWCEKHGISLTGHYVEEQNITGQMTCCAGVMPFYKYMHMPGIDWLNRSVGNLLSLRQIDSVAQQYGKKQVLSETYGCCGWDVTPAELKRIGDFQYVGGINRTCQHLIPYSEHGQRKRDYPSHFSPINPWIVDYFKDFNDYFTRLGYLLANSQPEVHIAMLHPMRSAYFDYKDLDVKQGNGVELLERAFTQQQEQLAADQIHYHFLDETLLEEDGFVRGSRIGCGLCEYDILLIPACYTMGRHTEKLIRQYVENGGKVLLLSEKPGYLEGEPYDYEYLVSNLTYDDLKDGMPYRLQQAVPGVHSTLRRWEHGRLLFVQNYSGQEKTVRYDLQDGYTCFEQWDLAKLTCKKVSSHINLKPGASRVLFFSSGEAETSKTKACLKLPPEAQVSSVTENYLPLDTVRYSKDGVSYSQELPYTGVFQQLLQERYEGQLYLKHTFRVTAKPERMSVIAEDSASAQLDVNGQPITLTQPWPRQPEFLTGDISPLIREGENEIVRKMHFYQGENVYYALFGEGVTETLRNCLSYDTEIEPLYLAGEFGVFAEKLQAGKKPGILLGSDFHIGLQPRQITNPVTDGFPFFAGTIRLERSVTLDDPNVILQFDGRFQAIRVWVNGSEAGSLLFEQELDISSFAKKGENQIVLELTVSNRNLFGPHHTAEDEEPESVGPYTFELPNTWEQGQSEAYRASYAFVPVAIR